MARRLAAIGLPLAILLVAAAPAGATVSAKSSPAYVKPVASAIHFWWHINYDTSASAMAVCFRFKVDNGAWQFPTNGDSSGVPPNTLDHPTGSCQSVGSGFNDDYYYRGDAITSGHAYFFCAKEWIFFAGSWSPSAIPAACPGGYFSNQSYDGVTLTGMYATTAKPTSPVTIDDGAQYTTDPALRVRVSYANTLGVPAWPATWVCNITDRACTNGDGAAFVYESGCSNFQANVATCTRNYGGPDGTVFQCVRAADQAVPDSGAANPPNLAAANAVNANLSDATCTSIVLDRAAPALTASASDTAPKRGQEVTFTAGADDATSGPSGQFSWNFGDGAAAASAMAGSTVKHTYATKGLRTVTVTTTDNAGNQSTKSIPVDVTETGETGTPGGTGTQTGSVGALTVLAPKKLSLKKSKRKLRLVLTPSTLGKASITLKRGKRKVASRQVTFTSTRAVSAVLRLPKSARRGRHKLVIVFTDTGGAKKTTTLKLTLT